MLALPVLDLRLAFSDESNFATDTTTRQAYELITEGFGPGFNGPLLLVSEVADPTDINDLDRLRATLADTAGVASVAGPIPNNRTTPTAAILQVFPTTTPQDRDTEARATHFSGCPSVA